MIIKDNGLPANRLPPPPPQFKYYPPAKTRGSTASFMHPGSLDQLTEEARNIARSVRARMSPMPNIVSPGDRSLSDHVRSMTPAVAVSGYTMSKLYNDPEIYLSNTGDFPTYTRPATALHEFMHAYANEKNVDVNLVANSMSQELKSSLSGGYGTGMDVISPAELFATLGTRGPEAIPADLRPLFRGVYDFDRLTRQSKSRQSALYKNENRR